MAPTQCWVISLIKSRLTDLNNFIRKRVTEKSNDFTSLLFNGQHSKPYNKIGKHLHLTISIGVYNKRFLCITCTNMYDVRVTVSGLNDVQLCRQLYTKRIVYAVCILRQRQPFPFYLAIHCMQGRFIRRQICLSVCASVCKTCAHVYKVEQFR